VHAGNRELDIKLKKQALERYTGKYRVELEEVLKRKMYAVQ
jgi:hypothetical protein